MKKLKYIEKYLYLPVILFVAFQLISPHYSIASVFQSKSVEAITEEYKVEKVPSQVVTVTITAYSSTVDQCDSTPFITASGTYVHDGTIAANFLPMGTIVKIPSVFGDKEFIVEDRMNVRYYKRIDIWFPTRQEALDFGIQTLEIEAYE